MMVALETLTLEQAHRRGYELVQAHTERFSSYVRALSEEQLAARVPGSDWTAGETIAHVQSVYLRYTVDRRRVDHASEMAARNAEDVAHLGVDVGAAAASMKEQLALMALAVEGYTPDQELPFHGGQTVTLAGAWGNLLGELLAHGDDIARATGEPFAIPSRDLEILWRFTARLLDRWMRAAATAHQDRWRLRFPFGPIDAAFESGRLLWDTDPLGPPDHEIEVEDTATFTLAFPYRRRPIEDPEVALLAARFHDT